MELLRRTPGVGASSTVVENRFVGGRRRSWADSSPVRTLRRGAPTGDAGFVDGGDPSAMMSEVRAPGREDRVDEVAPEMMTARNKGLQNGNGAAGIKCD